MTEERIRDWKVPVEMPPSVRIQAIKNGRMAFAANVEHDDLELVGPIRAMSHPLEPDKVRFVGKVKPKAFEAQIGMPDNARVQEVMQSMISEHVLQIITADEEAIMANLRALAWNALCDSLDDDERIQGAQIKVGPDRTMTEIRGFAQMGLEKEAEKHGREIILGPYFVRSRPVPGTPDGTYVYETKTRHKRMGWTPIPSEERGEVSYTS